MDKSSKPDTINGNDRFNKMVTITEKLVEHLFKLMKDKTCFENFDHTETTEIKKIMSNYLEELKTESKKKLHDFLMEKVFPNITDIKRLKDHRTPTGDPQIDTRHLIGLAMHGPMSSLQEKLKEENDKLEYQEKKFKELQKEDEKWNSKVFEEMASVDQKINEENGLKQIDELDEIVFTCNLEHYL